MIKDIKKIALTICAMICCLPILAQIKVCTTQPKIPVLTKKCCNPVLKVSLIKETSSNCFVEQITFSLDGYIGDIQSIGLYASNKEGRLNPYAH